MSTSVKHSKSNSGKPLKKSRSAHFLESNPTEEISSSKRVVNKIPSNPSIPSATDPVSDTTVDVTTGKAPTNRQPNQSETLSDHVQNHPSLPATSCARTLDQISNSNVAKTMLDHVSIGKCSSQSSQPTESISSVRFIVLACFTMDRFVFLVIVRTRFEVCSRKRERRLCCIGDESNLHGHHRFNSDR